MFIDTSFSLLKCVKPGRQAKNYKIIILFLSFDKIKPQIQIKNKTRNTYIYGNY